LSRLSEYKAQGSRPQGLSRLSEYFAITETMWPKRFRVNVYVNGDHQGQFNLMEAIAFFRGYIAGFEVSRGMMQRLHAVK
jgi:hypothetical protein